MLWVAVWLFIVVAAIAVIGHGIWVTVAAVLRALFDARVPEVKVPCGVCGHLTGAARPVCDWCGRHRAEPSGSRPTSGASPGRSPETSVGSKNAAAREGDDLLAVERQLERWRTAGRMKSSTAQRLMARVRAYAASMAPQPAAVAEPAREMVPATVFPHAVSDLLLRKKEAHQAASGAPPVASANVAPPGSAGLAGATASVSTHRPTAPVAAAIAPPSRVPQIAPAIAARQHSPSTAPSTSGGEQPSRRHTSAPPRVPAKPLPPPAPARRRRTLAEVFAAFMEERNIRWGELVGGALIVCSSVALVISLWETLKTIPYIQFFIFIGVSAALFGAGLYTHHRWKLASTSRGILIIATLLVPLNFVAMAGTARESWDLPAAVMQLAALAIFSVLVTLAGRALVAGERGWLTLAVVGNSAVTLLTPHRPALAWAAALAALPVALTAAAVGRAAWQTARRERLTADDVHRLFILLGTTMFALAVAAGLIVARSGDRTATLDALAPLAALAGMPVALCGLLAMRGLAREPELAGWRTAGTALALVGGLMMLAALGLAWPLPAALMAVGLLDAAALTILAVRYRFPAAHALAIACLAVAYITAVHCLWGEIGLMERASDRALLGIFASARTGTTLVGLFVALAAAAEVLARNNRRDDARFYVAGCGLVAAVSLSLVAVHGYLEGHANAWRAAGVFATYGVGCLALNARWRKPLGTHAGAALIGGAIVYALVYAPGTPLPYRWLAVASVQATWTLVVSLAASRGRAVSPALASAASEQAPVPSNPEAAADVFASPLRQWAKAASLLAVVFFLWSDGRLPLILSGYLLWLAALWLPLAIAEKSAGWFAAFQVALYASAGFALTAWLNEQPWVALDPRGLRQPRAWQFYGAALAGVSLAWVVLRVAWPARFPFVYGETVNSPPAQALDRWVHYALTAGSLALAVWGVGPDVCAELGVAGALAPPGAHADVFGASAWLLLGVLAADIVAALWHRWTKAELVGAALVAINAALLVAGPAADQLATASALRWSLATTFLIGAAVVCGRQTLAMVGNRLGCRVEVGHGGAAIVEGLLAAFGAAPVVLLSATVALMRINGQPTAGPLPGVWLGDLGMSVSHLIPLTMVVAGLVACAVREASAGYAFAGGLVANLTVCGGYALNVSQFGVTEAARLVQLATIVAAAWAVAWLVVRKRVLAWHARSESPAAWPLVRLQLAQGALGNVLLLLPALGLLALASPNPFAEAQAWIAAAGGPLGWLALAAALTAEVMAAWRLREPLRPEIVGLMGLTVIGLGACSVAAALPDTPWAYRALMLGWASYALSIVAAVWWASAVYFPTTAGGPPAALVRATTTWVRLAGSAALFLGIKTAIFGGSPEELSWAAGAIGIASAASAAMAIWRRQEEWAFAAGLGVNLAASLEVWHRLLIERRSPGAEWMLLVEANLIAAAGVALLWLAARRRMYSFKEFFSVAASPWLAAQVSAVAVGNLSLAMLALVDLLSWPDRATSQLVAWAAPAGWFAWLLGGAAVAVYVYHTARWRLAHATSAWLVGLGLLAAATVARSQPGWPAYHALIVAWSLVGLVLLVAGWLGDRLGGRSEQERTAALNWLHLLAPAAIAAQWSPAIEFLLAGLAVRAAASDPLRPWWPSATAVVASLLAGALACWRRQQASVYRSGLFVNLAVSLVWYAGADRTLGDLLLANATALAATAIAWSLASRVDALAQTQQATPTLPFEHAAAVAATALLTATAAINWIAACVAGSPALREAAQTDARLVWGACAAVIASLAVALADHRARFTWPCFYVAGLATVALALVESGSTGTRLVWASTPALAAWILAAALFSTLRSRAKRAADKVGWALPIDALPAGAGAGNSLSQTGSSAWFDSAQAALTALAMALTFWVCLAFDAPRDRLAGAIASAMLCATAILSERGAGDRWRAVWQSAVLLLAVVVPAQFGWTWLPAARPAILAIHRIAVALVSLATVIAWCEFAAPRLLAADGSWRRRVSRFLPVAIGCALLLLAWALGLERSQFVRGVGVPMALAATVAVAAVMLGMVLLALVYAVWGERDPWHMSPRGRTLYVYAAEALACLIFFHVRTTVPRLIPFGLLENWWTLVVMAVAFAGAGLAEWFQRRRLAVLAEPLARTALWAPLLPALAPLVGRFWHPHYVEGWLFQARYVPSEAVCFLAAIFYGLQATLKRSVGWGLLSAAAGNIGLWLLWDRLHFDFLVHPQLWLIPPALAALVAEYINRDRLASEQGAAVRYLALAVIYVSSTADVFISHVGSDISLPLVLVLMGLSICGVLAGMLLRVRSFLYLGVTFLLVDLSIMIYHAAWDLEHTWVFWAAGIAVGAAILALFGLFEKRRNEMEHALERFKQWQ